MESRLIEGLIRQIHRVREFAPYGLRIEGLALRRSMSGRITVSFPEKRDSSGRSIHLVRPLDVDTKRDLERQILEILAYEAPTSRD